MNTSLSDATVTAAAQSLNLQPAHLRALWEVEAAGKPFGPEGRPTILYEPHWFHRLTGGRFSAAHGGVSYPNRGKKPYPKSQADRWAQLEYAAKLDENAAYSSASYGGPQIMGFHHAMLGYPTAKAMADDFAKGADNQLSAFVRFIVHEDLVEMLRRKDWAGFARRYNGPAYAENHYDTKLAAAFKRHGGT